MICKLSDASQVELDIEISSSGSKLGAVGASLSEAKSNAVAGLERFKPLSSKVEKGNESVAAVGDGLVVFNNINNTWSPLLEKLKSFSELVDKVAEVSFYSSKFLLCVNVPCRSILMRKWLGVFCPLRIKYVHHRIRVKLVPIALNSSYSRKRSVMIEYTP